jgi:hypothetical protein
VTTPAEDLLEALAPFGAQSDENDGALGHLATAIAGTYTDIDALAGGTAEQPGWAHALTADTAPDSALAWLGQFTGTRPTSGETAEQRRDRVANSPAARRGTPAAIAAATQATLTGTKTVRIGERVGGDAYELLVATRDDETTSEPATAAAITAAVPAGIVTTIVVSNDLLYSEVAATLTDYADMEATFTDYTAVLTNT